MFKLSHLIGLVFLLSVCAAGARAQTPAADPEPARAELYGRMLRGRGPAHRQQRAAYETAREYLRKYGEPEDDIVRYLKSWVARYEAAVNRFYRPLLPERPDGPRPACRRRPLRGSE